MALMMLKPKRSSWTIESCEQTSARLLKAGRGESMPGLSAGTSPALIARRLAFS
jgi:hypothetical protein